MFWAHMWPSSGMYKQEYNYNCAFIGMGIVYDVLKLFIMGRNACFACYVLIFQECDQHQDR